MTENVNRAKAYSASLRKCLETMTNAELQLRIDVANAERSARIERENTCWDGGNSAKMCVNYIFKTHFLYTRKRIF